MKKLGNSEAESKKALLIKKRVVFDKINATICFFFSFTLSFFNANFWCYVMMVHVWVALNIPRPMKLLHSLMWISRNQFPANTGSLKSYLNLQEKDCLNKNEFFCNYSVLVLREYHLEFSRKQFRLVSHLEHGM